MASVSVKMMPFVLLAAVGMATAQVLLNPASRDCRELGTMRAENEVGGPVAEYSAGEVVMVKAQVPKVEGGVFEFYLCPEVNSETEECLIKVPLKLAVGQGVEIDLTKMSQGGLYEIPLILPEDVTCESCTLLCLVLLHQCGTQLSSMKNYQLSSYLIAIPALWEMVVTQCVTEGDDSCATWRSTTCANISIVSMREQQTRGWNFLEGFISKILQGASKGAFGRK